MDLIIRNANLNGQIKDIGIKGNTIVSVTDRLEAQAAQEIDAENNVVIPGFIDAHLHLDKSGINQRTVYQDVTGPEKGKLTLDEKRTFTVEDIIERAEKFIKAGIRAGNYAIRTNVDVDPIVGLKGIEALIHLREKYKDIVKIQVTAFSQEGIQKYPETVPLLHEAMKMGADLVGGHTIVDPDGEKHIDTILSMAKEYDVDAEFHLDESGKREHYLLPYVTKRMKEEKLEGRVNGIHCCTMSALEAQELEEAIQAILESQLNMIVAPTAISTRSLAPVKRLVKENILLGVGSDNLNDFFNPLGSADVRHVALVLAYVQRLYTDEEVESLWKMITTGGAAILKLNEYEIKEGNTAHITILDAKTPKEAIATQARVVRLIRNGLDITGQF